MLSCRAEIPEKLCPILGAATRSQWPAQNNFLSSITFRGGHGLHRTKVRLVHVKRAFPARCAIWIRWLPAATQNSDSKAVASNPSPPPEDGGRVVPFRQREGQRWSMRGQGGAPVRDLRQYERTSADDDYRHRMLMNLLGLAVTVLLIVAGVWIADKIADLRKAQDCYFSGRRNCNPIETPPTEH